MKKVILLLDSAPETKTVLQTTSLWAETNLLHVECCLTNLGPPEFQLESDFRPHGANQPVLNHVEQPLRSNEVQVMLSQPNIRLNRYRNCTEGNLLEEVRTLSSYADLVLTNHVRFNSLRGQLSQLNGSGEPIDCPFYLANHPPIQYQQVMLVGEPSIIRLAIYTLPHLLEGAKCIVLTQEQDHMELNKLLVNYVQSYHTDTSYFLLDPNGLDEVQHLLQPNTLIVGSLRKGDRSSDLMQEIVNRPDMAQQNYFLQI